MNKTTPRALPLLPHPLEWIVAARTNGEAYEKFAQFRYKSHAQAFAKSITVFQTVIIDPAMHGVAR